MILLFLILLISALVFLFYYEFIWKKVEQDRGKSLVAMARDFFAETYRLPAVVGARTASSGSEANWDDWKYRLQVELHRRERLSAQEAAKVVGISEERAGKYLDVLEGEGKIRQVGDSERGIFYKPIDEA